MKIPLLENTAMAIVLSDSMKSERVIIGEYLNIKRYFEMRGKEDFTVDINRPIGQFIKDFIPNAGFLADMFIEVNNGIFDRKLQQFYESGNPVYQYIALRVLQEYHSPSNDGFYDFVQDLRYHLFDGILNGQKVYTENPFAMMLPFGVNSKSVELMFDQRNMKEVAVITYDLLPLAMWYMRKIYDRGYYLQECRICRKTFLAKTATIEVLCGKKCKKENTRNLKKEYDERAKWVTYERTYKNEYMYWYNRLKNFNKSSAEYKAFNDFCGQAIVMKKRVKLQEVSEQDFLYWLFAQRNIVDKMVGKEKISPEEKKLRNRGKKIFNELNEKYRNHNLYEDWRKYAEMVLGKYNAGRFDNEDFDYLMQMRTFISDPALAERR